MVKINNDTEMSLPEVTTVEREFWQLSVEIDNLLDENYNYAAVINNKIRMYYNKYRVTSLSLIIWRIS